MAGIKIHNYPIERTSFGDDDYYDIDYWTGTAYETAKIKGSVLKSALGYSFVDIEAFISGYTLSANDAGKVITNSNTGVVRSLVINNTLSGAGNSFHVKGRVAIQPLTGVNVDLPDGTTITEPTQYTCEADTHYVLHRKASTGNDWVLSAINKDTLTNLGLSDLEQMDLVRVFEVFENGEFKFITNHVNSGAIFRVGENSEERFGEITLNSETFNQTVAVQNPTNDGQGIITRVNPNEFEVDSLDDITDVGTRRNRLYFNPQATTLEFTDSGRLILRNNGVPENIFEDLSPTKKGLQYNADYSADYTDRSLVDKGYVDASSKNIGNTNLSIPSATNRTVTLPADSTLAFSNLIKLFGTDFLTQILPSTYPNDADIPVNHIAYKLDNGKVLGRYRVDSSTYLDVKFGVDLKVYNGTDVSPLTQRENFRLEEFLEAVDNNVNGETIFRINPALLAEYTSPDMTNVSGVFRLLLDTNKIYFGGIDGLASQKTLTEVFDTATELLSDLRFHLVSGKIEPFMEQGKIWVGNANAVPESKTISEALDVLAIQTGVQFKVGLNGTVVPDLLPGYIFRGNANGEGVAQKLIQGNNKAIVTDESGNEQEVDLVSFLDLLSAESITGNGLLNTTDLGGTARGVLGSWKLTDMVIENTTANQVHINIGTTLGGNDIVSNFQVDANFFGNDIPILKSVFSKTTEQILYISSSNWNSANLNIKFSVKKVF